MNSPRKDQAAAAANGRMIEQAEETKLEVTNAQKLVDVIKWLNFICPLQKIPSEASEEELREILKDGNVLCGILNRISPGFIFECRGSSPEQRSENVSKFLSAIEERGLPGFQASDLEKGSMAAVVECLLTLRDHSSSDKCVSPARGDQAARKQYSLVWGEERRKSFSELRFQRILRSPRASEQLNETSHHVGQKFHEVFQLKQGRYSDLPAAKISEMLKSNSLDIAPTQSLLSVVNGILDESIERKNGEIPQRVACLLRRVVQEIERRISTQAEYIRNQNNLIKAREEKYQSRIRVLETLATGTSDETQIVMDQLKQIKVEKIKMEERKKNKEQDVVRLAKEKENSDNAMSALKEEVEITRKKYEERCVQLEVEAKKAKMELEKAKKGKMELEERLKGVEYLLTESRNRTKELEVVSESKGQTRKTYEERCVQLEVEAKKAKMELEEAKESKMELEERLKGVEYLLTESRNRTKELEADAESRGQIRKTYEERCAQLEVEAKKAKMELGEAKEGKMELEERLKGVEYLLTDSRNETKELEAVLESKVQTWSKKEHSYQNFIRFQLQALRELRMDSGSIRGDIINSQKSWQKEFNSLGATFEGLADVAKNYRTVLAENRKLYNEIQDLKGNIRVYCRVRPFLPGETRKQTILEYIGENGELVVSNPSKQGKDGHRAFKFDKVFGPSAIQEEVFLDTQPLIRSVLDGFNVCIFAYGQTGSGKTYTMTGPEASSEEEWGVNYRALNDLFHISQDRKATFLYEVAVQMVEIYNEQVRDLLTNENSQKRLGISNASNSSGLAVPDASMHPVKSTRDVIELMEFGHMNRAVGATALNQRSSRSHSVLTVHVRGSDLESGAILRGSLHLVDLAGSERVDRSEVTGDRLKEAQHINKSLSALGDVIFALSQKSSHVPYRNSKLTQVLQSSLGGQAKTLMFVQLNPNIDSYSESLSTLKFAERVSGIELGAARSNKEGKDVRELMDQVSSLKDMIARKDEEIERLQLLKGGQSPRVSSEMNGPSLLKHRPSSPNQPSPRGLSNRSRRVSGGKGTGSSDKTTSDSENSDKHSETSSHQSLDDIKHQKLSGMEMGQNFSADIELLGFNRVDSEEKLSDISDGSLSMGADTDGSTSSNVEVFAEGVKPAEGTERTASDPKSKVPSQIPRPPQKPIHAASTRFTSKVAPKVLTSSRKSTTSPAKSSSIKAISTSPPMGSSIKAASTSLGMTSSSKGTSKRWQ